jgi:hypothetical protein
MATQEELEQRGKILRHLEDALIDLRLAHRIAWTEYKKKEIEYIYNKLDKLANEIYEENFKLDE